MPPRTAAGITVCALSLGVLAAGAGVATAAPSPSPAASVDARAAAVDRCTYQVVRDHDSRYVYAVSGVFGGTVRELKFQKEADVRFSSGWRKVTQVDACAGGQNQAPTELRVTGKLDNPDGYEEWVPRTIRSNGLKPAASSSIPKAPAITSVDRVDAATVRVNWQPPQGSPDLVMLMERKPFYISELGLWDPYTFQRDVPSGATSTHRKLERDAAIPANVRTHSYWMRVAKNGFVNDLRTETAVDVQP
ncbi:hypothetical protein CP973_19945 [Streptomyces albofaciens JCM 4342]|uniref:hypothetical protein n=1 Tax=Streptomyces albofaciens TaxID=66866 RepID=UPI00123A6C04|nr:hypothetical protein [Streptomyces albofaciens]KAA6223886.1 hypothetical protein CP973_19945 [Streptomyces albofaciens JCM 4342]